MGKIRKLEDRDLIERHLRKNTALNIYQIGDLDDFFWPHTTWWGWVEDGETTAIALLYHRSVLPVLLCFADDKSVQAGALLGELGTKLPTRFYGHLTPGLETGLEEKFSIERFGDYQKMILTYKESAGVERSREVAELTIDEKTEVEEFFRASYPGNWFDARMLETGHYFGIRESGRMVAAGGVHVYSPKYSVAALGNIATHPDFRGRGLASEVTAAICTKLRQTINDVGLNVGRQNRAAIKCYNRLGFEFVAPYSEFMFTRRA